MFTRSRNKNLMEKQNQGREMFLTLCLLSCIGGIIEKETLIDQHWLTVKWPVTKILNFSSINFLVVTDLYSEVRGEVQDKMQIVLSSIEFYYLAIGGTVSTLAPYQQEVCTDCQVTIWKWYGSTKPTNAYWHFKHCDKHQMNWELVLEIPWNITKREEQKNWTLYNHFVI